MRDIKFRAWDKFNGCYWYSFSYENLATFFWGMQLFVDGGNELIYQEYTGLKDKDGKEIYEGDKCNCRMIGTETHVEEVVTKVIYDLTVGAFGHQVISENSDYTFFGLNSRYLLETEITGNIYEHSELINK